MFSYLKGAICRLYACACEVSIYMSEAVVHTCACRYVTRADYADTHRNSAPFKHFKAAAAQLPFNTTLQARPYLNSLAWAFPHT
jgi:hypothetical protein